MIFYRRYRLVLDYNFSFMENVYLLIPGWVYLGYTSIWHPSMELGSAFHTLAVSFRTVNRKYFIRGNWILISKAQFLPKKTRERREGKKWCSLPPKRKRVVGRRCSPVLSYTNDSRQRGEGSGEQSEWAPAVPPGLPTTDISALPHHFLAQGTKKWNICSSLRLIHFWRS